MSRPALASARLAGCRMEVGIGARIIVDDGADIQEERLLMRDRAGACAAEHRWTGDARDVPDRTLLVHAAVGAGRIEQRALPQGRPPDPLRRPLGPGRDVLAVGLGVLLEQDWIGV